MTAKNSKTANPNNHLKDLLLLFAIPAAIAIFAAAVVYIPRLLANPKHDFIYSVCDDYRCSNGYSVNAAGYVAQKYVSSSDYYDHHPASLRYYTASNDSTRSLTLEEAKQYGLDSSSKSPDGYTLSRESSSSGFLFWGDYDEGWYLKNGTKKKKITITNGSPYYSRDVTFLGWVTL